MQNEDLPNHVLFMYFGWALHLMYIDSKSNIIYKEKVSFFVVGGSIVIRLINGVKSESLN